MEDLKQKIQAELTQSLKKGDKITLSTLRMLLTAISNKEKEKRYKIIKAEPQLNEEEIAEKAVLTSEEIIEIVVSEVKKRKEAILGFEKGEREDLAKKEKAEMEVLKKYLPEQISEEDIKKLAQEIIEKTGVKEMKDVGKVMKEIMPKVKGKADGATVSRITKELLSFKSE